MRALLLCQGSRSAELLTVALRQVGLSGIVRKTAPKEATQLAEIAVAIIDAPDHQTARSTMLELKQHTVAPVIVVCDNLSLEDTLELYERGAAVVLRKPIDLRIVAVQALALTRLTASATIHPAQHMLLDQETQTITLPHGRFRLTTLEFRLLASLLRRPGRVARPETLVEDVWGYRDTGDRSLVKGLVNRVRRKIEPDPQHPRFLLTEAGIGYYFVLPDNMDFLAEESGG
ncbi:MAG: DNA-binding response regulator [Caldilineae bacterium]|nr:MAG: DNA-binding response regulator [Caldilineae bacterium]